MCGFYALIFLVPLLHAGVEDNAFEGIPQLLCAKTKSRTGPRSSVGRAPDSKVRGPGLDTRSGHILSISVRWFKRGSCQLLAKYVHEVQVNRLGGLSLPRKSVVRLTNRHDMTLDVYRGRKTTTQQQQLNQGGSSVLVLW